MMDTWAIRASISSATDRLKINFAVTDWLPILVSARRELEGADAVLPQVQTPGERPGALLIRPSHSQWRSSGRSITAGQVELGEL